jgi:hypothetical protein
MLILFHEKETKLKKRNKFIILKNEK